MASEPNSPITHVFVLMLENHSFDCVFALSGIQGICRATSSDSNSYGGKTYNFGGGAPPAMPTDPGHEFTDVVQQLAGLGAVFPSGGPYPAIDNSGFAANYATTTSEGWPSPPPPADIGDIMAGFATARDLPVIYALATQFVLCDHWFSSLPGPTWPNRFFLHGASSAGLDHSPTLKDITEWYEFGGGFAYPNGSIFDRLSAAGVPYRLYVDSRYPYQGAIPQVAAIEGISYFRDINDLSDFSTDIMGKYDYAYTFIEPNYGYVSSTYEDGSSQHPMDGVANGEQLIRDVYQAIRNSPVWNSSLLIITYDEHGGFYDHFPPGLVVAPGDTTLPNPNSAYGFTFEQLGVRVPAVLVSPWLPAGKVDSRPYDHSSVLATIEKLFGVEPLTKRDAAAFDVISHTLTMPRTDCPTALPQPAPRRPRPAVSDEVRAAIEAQPLPQAGSLPGFLGVALKTNLELSRHAPAAQATALAEFHAVQTRGQAKTYLESTVARVKSARAALIAGGSGPSGP